MIIYYYSYLIILLMLKNINQYPQLSQKLSKSSSLRLVQVSFGGEKNYFVIFTLWRKNHVPLGSIDILSKELSSFGLMQAKGGVVRVESNTFSGRTDCASYPLVTSTPIAPVVPVLK